VTNRRKSY